MAISIQEITEHDIGQMEALMSVFGTAFSDLATYTGNRPSAHYLQSLLASDHFIALVAVESEIVIGGLAAYTLKKFEQERSEIYVYDLAVAQAHRRKGIATALIQELKVIGARRGAHLIFIQADTGAEDLPAIELYSKLGKKVNVLHFDIEISDDHSTA